MKPYIFLLINLLTYSAAAQNTFRFEAETGVSSLRLPQPYRAGWHVRQQLTAYVRPRLGVSLGLGWGGSANNDPLTQLNPNGRPDARAILDFYNRQERMTDLTAVWLPVLSRRHQLKLQAGLSLQRRREVSIDSIFYERPGQPFYDAVPTYVNQTRVMPMVAAGYDFRLSSRWAVGVNAVAYLGGNDQTVNTFGVRTSYRFNVSRDSLGISPGPGEPLAWGIRVAVNRVGDNASSSASVRNVTRGVAGVWAEYPLSLTWGIRGEANYAQRGYRMDGYKVGTFQVYGQQTEATYLELPLLFRHEVSEKAHLYIGPYLALLLSGTYKSDAGTQLTLDFHTNSGLAFGADYQLTKKLFVDLRYQRDLLQISTTPYSNTFHSYQLGLVWAVR